MTNQSSSDLAVRDSARPLPPLAGQELEETFRIAKALHQSGLFKDVRQAEQAFAKIVVGRDLGLNPAESMSALHIIEGKVEASADLHASRVKASAKYDYTVQELTTERCEILFWQAGDELGTSVFTMEDAETAGLAKKDVWKKYPRNLLFARAMSNGVAWYCPDVMGGLRIYHEGEVPRRDVSVGQGSYTEPEDLRATLEKWAPSRHWASVIATTIERAREVGHAGYADYGTVELRLKGKRVVDIQHWVRSANQDMDHMVESRPSEDDSQLTAEPEELEARANQKADAAIEARDSGNDELAGELETEAQQLHERAEAARQMELS